MKDQKPSIGRIVHYRDLAGKVSPAIITAVHSERVVNLTVFPDLKPPFTFKNIEIELEPKQSMRWSWPPRA